MKQRKIAVILAGAMVFSNMTMPVLAAEGAGTEELAVSAFDTDEFADPGIQYRPGVRWWWPGGAVDEETLKKEIDYLSDKGFGYVEINPFDVSVVLEGDEERVLSIYTPEFYKLLDIAVSYCEEKGITVDLNMGSGWNANSQDVTYEESMGNMALGRTTVSGAQAKEAIAVPGAERSCFYVGDSAKGEWKDESVKLQGILVAELTGEKGTDFVEGEGLFGPKPSYEDVYDEEGNVMKSYDTQVVLNPDNSFFIEAGDAQIQDGNLVLSEELQGKLADDKNYEIVAMYYLPSGGKAIDSAPKDWYTVDHMDAEKVAGYLNDWLGNENLSAILESHTNVRALFNDSYEFYSDIYYTEGMEALAKDSENNGLGYDFSKYLPTVYKQYSAAPYYMGLGTSDTYLSYTLDEGEKARISYDYNTLVNKKFQEGMEAFQKGSNKRGLLYRQEAYNPPIDTIGSARYIDIPEAEQANEFDLIRASSGAHLYGKNLVTCEQYTLGRTPLANSLEQVKIGYDIMATSGVNNFFYHGLMYGYGVDSEEYGEIGWAPFPDIGINMSERNTLSEYFGEMNDYAARVNYLMQQGKASRDVAYYMPFNGSLSETDAVKTMNHNGISWEAVNDDSITAEDTQAADGQIQANGGTMVYDALVVESDKVPGATMEKLQALAEAGANIIFYGAAPQAQPGYQDGNYAEEDAKVAAASQAILDNGGTMAENTEEFAKLLDEKTTPEVSYETNENVRFIRRTLDDGAELVYIRNISTEENTITVDVADEYGNCYFLDQTTGKIYNAEKAEDGTVSFTMDASIDSLGGMSGDGVNSMAIALLCEKEGVSLNETAVSEGIPSTLDQTEAAEIREVDINSLQVGEKTYSDNILGKWNSDEFQGGELKNSDETGIYTGTVKLEALEGKKAVLTLSEVYTAARIKVNGTEVGDILYAPYEIDITDAASEGDNTVEIQVTPRKYNAVHQDAALEELVDTGLAGSVSVEIR
ncbi:MAG: glycosyl hydrolase [Eubacteriales bacterium]|nr:glycosyl hydrolase [Eubacteriales bacterium]